LTTTYLDLLARRNVQVIAPALCPTCFMRNGPQPKQHGEVKWFSQRKHYGFIVSDSGEELFFHQQQIVGSDGGNPQEGQPVRFHVHYPFKGPEALNVEVIVD
jgi:CspA family cold shock protein